MLRAATRSHALSGLLLALSLVVACGRHPVPATAPTTSSPTTTAAGAPGATAPASPRTPESPGGDAARTATAADEHAACDGLCTPSHRLGQELAELFTGPSARRATWSALVESLDTGEVLFRLDPERLVIPASNMKLVTVAVAASRLGWDYRYETRLEATAPVTGGVLRGDLIVVGSGDPSINRWFTSPAALFDEWAADLRAMGVSRIAGGVLGDGRAFADEPFGAGWEWDDFVYDYSAPVTALQIDENSVDVVIRPGDHVGDPASATLTNDLSGLTLLNGVVTSGAGTPAAIDVARVPGRTTVFISGTIPVGAAETRRSLALENPTLAFARALRAGLIASGIAVDGGAGEVEPGAFTGADQPHVALAPSSPRVAADAALESARRTDRSAGHGTAPAVTTGNARPAGVADRATDGAAPQVLARHLSPPLADIAERLAKVSQNLYAETLFRTLSASPGPASIAASRTVEEDVLMSWGIAPEAMAIADGSGLSRRNLVCASAVVRILKVMARDPSLAGRFETTLPVAGQDGTLRSRLRATRAEGNVKAKTGSMTFVRSLSGYLHTADGERLVFSFLANHFTSPRQSIDAIVDQAIERLVSFSRFGK